MKRHTLTKSMIFLLVAVLGLAGCGETAPTPTPTSMPTLTPAPTSTPTLTPTPTSTSTPTPSLTPTPGGGGRIAFANSGEIYVMDADGSHLTNLTNDPAVDVMPAWSPDGKRIAFRSSRGGNANIYVMDADGSHVTRLTDYPSWDMSPVWSPDGTRIAFFSDRDDPNPVNCMPCNSEIYVMNADGSNLTRLTDNPAGDSSPTWSPDGTRIAFSSNRDGNGEIYVMNADGSNVTRLTDNPASDSNPAWSPDGKHIAFTSKRDGNPEIYVMDADGSNVTRLTDNPASDGSPDWSPDGIRLAFESSRDSPNPAGCPDCDYEIYVMDADGSNVTRLTINPAWDNDPVWQP